jgi:hypothetical protein
MKKSKNSFTVKEFVLEQKAQNNNEWIKTIKNNGFENHEELILKCADYYNLIIINHSANFENSII